MRGDTIEIHCGPDVLLLARFGALSRLPLNQRGSQPAIGLMRRMAYDREAMGQLRRAWSRWNSDAMSSRMSDELILRAVTQDLKTGALHGLALPRARLAQSYVPKPKSARRPIAAAPAQLATPIFTPRPLVTTAADAAARAAALPKPVSQWPLEDRISAVVKKTIPKVPGQFGDALLELISPENIAIMAVCIGISVAANLTPAGWIADAVLAGVAFYFGGMVAIHAIGDLIDVMRLIYSAQSEADLNAAADKLAKVIALIGVIGLQALLHKIAAKKRMAGSEKNGSKGASAVEKAGKGESAGGAPGKPLITETSPPRPNVSEPAALKPPETPPPKTKKKKSLRLQYVGRTPGKASTTGKAVIDRMHEEGKIRTDLESGATQFKSSDGKWYDLSKADMAHKVDAVSWWNQTGRKFGAKSFEVREWMRKSENYELQLFSDNRSLGAKLGQKEGYLPPLL